VEQPQYNLFEREKVESEFSRLYEDIGIGLTTWSPLASGMLTGKYINGIPKGSRGALDGYDWLKNSLTNQERIEKVKKLLPIAKELGCTMAQLAIAWCAKNPNVTTVMTGASRVEQVKENMKAVEVLPKLVPDVMAQIDEIVK
jgi:aryl-alcohol dehydrogenase-like predicted oxidoreductase